MMAESGKAGAYDYQSLQLILKEELQEIKKTAGLQIVTFQEVYVTALISACYL